MNFIMYTCKQIIKMAGTLYSKAAILKQQVTNEPSTFCLLPDNFMNKDY